MRELLRRASLLQAGDSIDPAGDGVPWHTIDSIERSGTELIIRMRGGSIVNRLPNDFVPVRSIGAGRLPDIKVGAIARAKWTCTESLCPACSPGEAGVCFIVAEPVPTNAYTNYFIFENGGYGGFTCADVHENFLWLAEETCPKVAGYRMESWDRLERDFKRGVFKPAFDMVRAAPRN